VLQNLLRERVPVRDIDTIIETLGDWAPKTKDLDVLDRVHPQRPPPGDLRAALVAG
jgi:flagellar biosynthesis component FlhA